MRFVLGAIGTRCLHVAEGVDHPRRRIDLLQHLLGAAWVVTKPATLLQCFTTRFMPSTIVNLGYAPMLLAIHATAIRAYKLERKGPYELAVSDF